MPRNSRVVLLIPSSSAYGRRYMRGIVKYSLLQGQWIFCREPLFYNQAALNPNILSLQAISELGKWDADGIIAHVIDPDKVKMIHQIGLPTVGSAQIEEPVEGLINVTGDHFAMSKMAAEHLLGRGFSNFAYCGFPKSFVYDERCKGFIKRIAKAGFEAHVYKPPISKIGHSWAKEQAVMVDWLKSLPKPIGIMAGNDDRGQNVIDACGMASLHVPYQVAVIGVDNDELTCNLCNPPMSSVNLNIERAGYEAAETLDKMMAGDKIKKHLITVEPTHIVTRTSTDTSAIEDPELAKAIRFIREHGNEMIQVNNVVEIASVSRSYLEKQFKKMLGCSILDEIRRVRTNQIAKILVETNLPVSQIASNMGFANFKNIARYFQKQKGITLLEYRKHYGQK